MVRRTKNRISKLAMCLALCAIIIAQTPCALAEDDARYIVKFNEYGAFLSEGGHFDVVGAAELPVLLSAGLIEWYEPDEIIYLSEEDTGSLTGDLRWELELIHADEAIRRGFNARGVRIGVIDSGVSTANSLAANVLPGHNYVDSNAITTDKYGHGTRVAGIIAGSNGTEIIGTASGAEIVPLKITDGSSVSSSHVYSALYDAIDIYGCDIINMSLGFTSDHLALREAIDYAAEKGVLIVAAAGNKGNTALMYPAAYDSVIGVGAVNSTGSVWSKSNHNSSVMLTAPGEAVTSLNYWGGLSQGISGTSYSTPFVTAAAAVLLGIDPTLTPAEITALLCGNATDRGAEGWDEYYGYGILNIEKSVIALAGEYVPDTPLYFTEPNLVRNYTDAPVSCVYLLTRYDSCGRMISVDYSNLSVPAGESVEVSAPEDGELFSQILCEEGSFIPICSRKS